MAIGVHNVCEAGNIVYGDRPCSVCGATSDERCRSIDAIQDRIDERADAAIDAAMASQKHGGAE